MFAGSLQRIGLAPKNIDDYSPIVPEVVEQIRALSKNFQGLRITHVNATAVGGGVAEMLRSIVPLQNDLGLSSQWLVIPPNDQFFEITKKIHNLMQGQEGGLTDEQKKYYLDYNNFLAGLLSEVKTDILIIHDPQPLAALSFLNGQRPKHTIWRCHIDTSHPNQSVWEFLLPYIKPFDRYVFSLPEYAHKDFSDEKLKFITPVIDPLAEKNIALSKEEALEVLQNLGVDSGKPLISQISRLDPWKDPEGVVDAYRLAKKEIPDLQLALVAQMATDDPEGAIIYEKVKKYINGEQGIFLLVNLKDNEKAVNAFQVGSDIILQKSIREGFGLTVTEAMWKGAVVIGGNVGGIKLQIQDGESGFLVNSSKEAAEKIVKALKDPELREKISHAAKLSVKNSFLTPHNILYYFKLFQEMLGIQSEHKAENAFREPTGL